MHKKLGILLLSLISLISCSSNTKNNDVVPNNSFYMDIGVWFFYTKNGVPLFTDSVADYNTVHQISFFPLTSNTGFGTSEGTVMNGVVGYYGDSIGYVLRATATGKSNFNIGDKDTAYVGIKFPGGQVDTLIEINQRVAAGTYLIVKCLYNSVVKFDVIPEEPSVVPYSGVNHTIEVEKQIKE